MVDSFFEAIGRYDSSEVHGGDRDFRGSDRHLLRLAREGAAEGDAGALRLPQHSGEDEIGEDHGDAVIKWLGDADLRCGVWRVRPAFVLTGSAGPVLRPVTPMLLYPLCHTVLDFSSAKWTRQRHGRHYEASW